MIARRDVSLLYAAEARAEKLVFHAPAVLRHLRLDDEVGQAIGVDTRYVARLGQERTGRIVIVLRGGRPVSGNTGCTGEDGESAEDDERPHKEPRTGQG